MENTVETLLSVGCIVGLALLLGACSGPDLTSSKSAALGLAKAPYANYAQYYGYIDPDTHPNGTYRNKDAYYLYVWVPAAVDEIGVSMKSPAEGSPGDNAFVQSNYKNKVKKNPDAWFDTYLVLERMKAKTPSDIRPTAGIQMKLAENDDNGEMPKNPRDLHRNSLLRVNSADTPLVRGLYRITFTSFRGDIEGSFVANVGTNVPGVKIAASANRLKEMVQSSE